MSEVDVEQMTVRIQHDVAWVSVLHITINVGVRLRAKVRMRWRG